MANINITWTNPAVLSDIDEVQVFRIAADRTADDLSDATVAATFRSDAGTPITTVAVANLTAAGTNSYTDEGVTAGDYTYAAFSKNQGGFGPGDQNDTVLSVS